LRCPGFLGFPALLRLLDIFCFHGFYNVLGHVTTASRIYY
jgi:hypothetical protein